MTDAIPYHVPREPGRWRALTLAAMVHAALFAFLWVGVRWQNETPATIEAEVWSPQVQEAAPLPEPEPEVRPEPKQEIKEIPKPVPVQPPVEKPDIALEQEKKRKEKEQKAHEEEVRREKKRAEEKRTEKEKIDAAKKKAEELKKETAEKKRKELAEQQRLDQLREAEMRRITGGVTGTGGSGDAPKAQGSRADPGYAQRVGAKIKSNISFNVPEGSTGNQPVEYVVNLLPDGSVAGMRKTKSSGVPGFDEAVQRAIEKSQPYPRDKSGSVPPSFIGTHRPKDQ